MKSACPNCERDLLLHEHGGLFELRCESCGWHEEGTVNRALFPPESGSSVELVARSKHPVTAQTLKLLRKVCRAAALLTPAQVLEQLQSEYGLNLGVFPLYRANEV